MKITKRQLRRIIREEKNDYLRRHIRKVLLEISTPVDDKIMLNTLRGLASQNVMDELYLGKNDWKDTLSTIKVVRKMGGFASWHGPGIPMGSDIPDSDIKAGADSFYAWMKANGAEMRGEMETTGKPLQSHPGYTMESEDIFGSDGTRVGAVKRRGDDWHPFISYVPASKSGKRLKMFDSAKTRATAIKQVVKHHKSGK